MPNPHKPLATREPSTQDSPTSAKIAHSASRPSGCSPYLKQLAAPARRCGRLRSTGLCTAEYRNPSELRLDLKIVAGSEQRCHIAIFEAVDESKLRKRCALR